MITLEIALTADAIEYAYGKLRHPPAPATLGDLLRYCGIKHIDFTHWTETPEALADRLLQLIGAEQATPFPIVRLQSWDLREIRLGAGSEIIMAAWVFLAQLVEYALGSSDPMWGNAIMEAYVMRQKPGEPIQAAAVTVTLAHEPQVRASMTGADEKLAGGIIDTLLDYFRSRTTEPGGEVPDDEVVACFVDRVVSFPVVLLDAPAGHDEPMASSTALPPELPAGSTLVNLTSPQAAAARSALRRYRRCRGAFARARRRR